MDKKFDPKKIKLGVVGLGYVGLPLAVGFAQKLDVNGYDRSHDRIEELLSAFDATAEVDKASLLAAKRLKFSSNIEDLKDCNCFVVAVPTPVDGNKVPDLAALTGACYEIGSILKSGDIVIFESTVFPGATEEICAPILEKRSGLQFICDSTPDASRDGFHLGYSPERVNPGDKSKRIEDIIKITSGSTPEAAEYVDQLYQMIIKAGTHKAESIKIAEAAKIIENIQRDVNIALMNELSIIFNMMHISTQEVLKAAQTKWNFVPFYPGLVGGHCIGVDPYYLAHKSKEFGYTPEIILAGRRINETMPSHTANLIVKLMLKKHIIPSKSRVLMLGVTFKENCPDLRNSKSIELAQSLIDFGCDVDVIEPMVKDKTVQDMDIFSNVNDSENYLYDAVVLAVPHQCFIDKGVERLKMYQKKCSVFFDVRSVFDRDASDGRL